MLKVGLSPRQAMECNLDFRKASTPQEQQRVNEHYSLVEDMNGYFPHLMSEWLFPVPQWLVNLYA